MTMSLQNNPGAAPAIRVLFFSTARSATGVSESMIPFEGTMDEDALWKKLMLAHPSLDGLRAQIRLARNGKFVRNGELFQPGDEVAVIPPVSGG
jgi:molybdopterin converting factor subunit 1